MRAIILSLFVTFLSTTAFAADDLLLSCRPTPAGTNGLNIFSIELTISQADPEATMVLATDTDRQIEASLSYHSNGTEYELIPNTDRDGPYSVYLRKTGPDMWEATVAHEYIDTFSKLECPVPFSQIGYEG